MKQLTLAASLQLPLLEAVTQTFAILGKRGSGKTTTATVLVEEMLAAGQHVVVVDPLDVTWGLRASRDGKTAGFPITVLGGDHADLPLEASAGAVIAEFVVEHQAPLILSLRHFSMNDQRRFVTDFCERLYALKGKQDNRQALHLVIDEADEFAPQRIPHGHERMFGAIDRIVRRGRASGLGVTLISQRAAVVHKDVLSQAEVLICHQTISPQDRKALESWIEAHDAHGQGDAFMASLASLKRGEAWVWSPGWLDLFQRVQVRDRKTFDSSATPKAGERHTAPKQLAAVDLQQLQHRMKDTIQKAKADDPRELKKEIARLQQQIKSSTTPQTVVNNKRVLTDADRQLLEKVGLLVADVGRVLQERDTQTDDRLQSALRGVIAEYTAARTKHTERAAADASRVLESKGLQKVLAKLEGVAVATPGRQTQPRLPVTTPQTGASDRLHPRVASTRGPVARAVAADTGNLPPGEHATLTAALQYEGLDRKRLGILTGYKRSSRDAYIVRLASKGLIEVRGAQLFATEAGRAAMNGSFEPLPTGQELIDYWRQRLPEGERKTLDVLIEHGGHEIERDIIDRMTGYKRSSRDAYLVRLKARGLVEFAGRGTRESQRRTVRLRMS